MYYFTCISFAIRPWGRKSAIKLIDWLIDSLDASTTTPELRTIPLTLTPWPLNLNPLTQSPNPLTFNLNHLTP